MSDVCGPCISTWPYILTFWLNVHAFYRNVSENITKCDNILSSTRTLIHVFSGSAIAARIKLREACEKAILSGYSLNKQKMEEILWRKVYYDPFSTAKKLRQVRCIYTVVLIFLEWIWIPIHRMIQTNMYDAEFFLFRVIIGPMSNLGLYGLI